MKKLRISPKNIYFCKKIFFFEKFQIWPKNFEFWPKNIYFWQKKIFFENLQIWRKNFEFGQKEKSSNFVKPNLKFLIWRFSKKIKFIAKFEGFSSNLKIFKKNIFCQFRCFFVKFEDFQKKIFFAKNRCFLAKFEVFSSNLKIFKKIFFCQN